MRRQYPYSSSFHPQAAQPPALPPPANALRRPAAAPRQPAAVLYEVAGRQYLWLVIVLFWAIFYLNMPDNLDGFSSKGGVFTGNALARNIKVGMIALSLLVIATQWSTTRALARNLNLGQLAFLVLAPVSAVWSIDSSATFLRYISLLSVVLPCFAVCLAGWQPRRFQQVALPPLMLILVASLIVGMIYPERITEAGNDISQKGAWHGITHGKNEFGMISACATLICANRFLSREGRTFWALVGAIIAFTCLVLSRSNTSLFATLLGGFAMFLTMRVPIVRRRYTKHVFIGLALTILLYELVIQDVLPGVHTLLSPITGLTGKDTTFSARTIIWKVIKDHISLAPYLGSGYGAYWLGPQPTSPSYVFVALMYFYPMEAHNGYLDIINDLGYLGLGCLLLFLGFYLRQGLQLMKYDRNQATLYLALMLEAMVINMSESDWFSRTNTFAVLVLGMTCTTRALIAHRART